MSPQTDLQLATVGSMPYVESKVSPSTLLNQTTNGLTPDQDISFYESAKHSFNVRTKLNKENSVCINASSPQALIALNQKGEEQCGWYYNEKTGMGSGYLSTTKGSSTPGPVQGLELKPPVEPYRIYYGKYGPTNLEAAQKRFHKDKCNQMTCSQAGNATYKGICGYCTSISKGIPINSDGSITYPEMGCGGSLANLIINSGDTSRCPAPPPPRSVNANLGINPATGQIAGNIRPVLLPNVGNCQPDTLTNQFSGACLQSALVSQGCDEQGGLALALNGFKGKIEAKNVLEREPTLQEYLDTQPLFQLNRFLDSDTMADVQTQALALSTASSKGLSNAAQSSADALAISLCKQNGYKESGYNFCGDLTDSTPRPGKWRINCLQDAFKTAGLKETGEMYPKDNNKAYAFYNTLATWKDVKTYMQNIRTAIDKGGPRLQKHIELFQNQDTVSAPFRLESVNFKGLYVRFMGENKQLEIQKPNDPNDPQSIPKDPQSFLFVWKQGLNNTVKISPVLNTSLFLYIVKEGRWQVIASSQDSDNQFHVRPGNEGIDTISFELLSNPTLFLRHWDRIFYVDAEKTFPYFKGDSSFYIESKGFRQTSIFFQNAPDPSYVGQQEAVRMGLGINLDLPNISFTQSGIEVYSTAVYYDKPILVYYSVMPSWTPGNPLSSDWEWTVYTMANYTFATTQTVQATLILETATNNGKYKIGVNTYLSGGPILQLKQFNDLITKNFEGGVRPVPTPTQRWGSWRGVKGGSLSPSPIPFEVRGSAPTIIKNQIHGVNYSFTLNPSPTITIVRDPKAPFLKFEVLANRQIQPIFTEIRYPEIASITYPGMTPQFQNSPTDILRIPGTAGAIILDKNQVNINYVSGSAWASSSFVFNITSILPCDQNSSCPLLTIGTQTGSGYRVAVYGSTTGSMNLVVQPLTNNGSIASTSVPIAIQSSLWSMISITPTALILYYINTQTNMPTMVGTISLGNAQNIGAPNPLIQIGSQSSSLNFSVAWLHLFDKTITTVDPVLELQGYPTGLF
jgi:hypothetical protein